MKNLSGKREFVKLLVFFRLCEGGQLYLLLPIRGGHKINFEKKIVEKVPFENVVEFVCAEMYNDNWHDALLCGIKEKLGVDFMNLFNKNKDLLDDKNEDYKISIIDLEDTTVGDAIINYLAILLEGKNIMSLKLIPGIEGAGFKLISEKDYDKECRAKSLIDTNGVHITELVIPPEDIDAVETGFSEFEEEKSN